MSYEFEPWKLDFVPHRNVDEELNGNYVQLSIICSRPSNVLFPKNTARKDSSQMSYFDFGGQQLAELM